MRMEETCPCKDCPVRQWSAIAFDIHFNGDDCPYLCDKYERWREERG